MPDPGTDVFVIDDTQSGGDPTATDTLFMLSSAGSSVPVQYFEPSSADDTLNNSLSTYFNEGGVSVYVMGHGNGTTLPEPADAVAELPAGPGQITCTDVVTESDLVGVIDAGWAQNKVTLCNGPSNASDSALQTLAAAIIAGSNGGSRGAMMCADVGLYSLGAPPATANVPWPVTLAGMIAANDRVNGFPHVAAAGKNGISLASGLLAERSDTARTTLKTSQINTAKTVQAAGGATIRNYGVRTLADLDTVPGWWDFWASRTIMGLKARFQSLGEDFVFQTLDLPSLLILNRFGAALKGVCKSFTDATALASYTVDVGPTVNTRATIQAGQIKGRVRVVPNGHAEHIEIDVIRNASS